MAETLVYEDTERREWMTTSGGTPGTQGYWEVRRIEWKVATPSANLETLRTALTLSLAVNATYAASTKPGTAAAQASAAFDATQRHARQISGLIRLLLGQLDATT